MNLLPFITYLVGFLLAVAYDDLSYNKVATQSPIYPGSPTRYGAHNAVDRNTLTCMRTEQIGHSSPYKIMWLKVDLGGLYNIYSINILFQNYDGQEKRQRGRLAGFSLYVSTTGDISGSTLCYKDGPELPPLNFTTVCTESGRYMIFYNERLDGVPYPDGYEVLNVYIELCEVIVQGCNRSGVYGRDCNISCPTNCKNGTCHIQNGTCSACNPGWTGILCEKKCKEWTFGDTCSEQCEGHCRDSNTCNHVTGQCDEGCDAGWTGSTCGKECDDGTYGYDCVNNCSGHCLNNSICNKQNGHCDKGCKPGYTNDNCSKACDEGYYGANCTRTCFPNCNICQHTDGSCSSCKKGYYGRNCSLVCFPNCKSDTCQPKDSLCTCAAGWMGDNCTEECDKMWYGVNCSQRCVGHCKGNDSCNHVTGQCDGGCDAGWTQSACDKEVLQHPSENKDNSTSTTFFLISLTINSAFLTGCFLFIWGIYTKRVSIIGFNPSCWERSEHYADTDIKAGEDTTYQELDPPREEISITYQNTILQ